MITSQKVIIIEKIEKPYDFDGNVGVSVAVRALIGTDVLRLKTKKDVLDQVEIEKSYQGEIQIRSVKETPVFELLSVKKTV